MSGLEVIYDDRFYQGQIHGSLRSANLIVPMVLNSLAPISSVVDVGCGAGTWLSAFKRNGVLDILGVDGGAVPAELLQIPPENFKPTNLENEIHLDRRFDLCVTLEVAEHLTFERAEFFVNDLCALSDVVLFSAAIPGQGGDNHINEAWPSYWKNFFAKCGYKCCDIFRSQIWSDARIEWWYAQNLLLFVKETRHDILAKLNSSEAQVPSDIVHPACFSQIRDTLQRQVEEVRAEIAEIKANPVWKYSGFFERMIKTRKKWEKSLAKRKKK